uniref:Oxidoreductase n=1 Tax=Paulinella micropora TaxID=1928728 RepID=A0A385I0T9_9EUKA|nr:Oxidoreductase [Paulinella micropora]AXY63543.1 Oxidoreductase [Paulinella micropora]
MIKHESFQPGIGVGTWAWGNRFLWNYNSLSDDSTLHTTFNTAISLGLNFFDTADSYGTGNLNGRSESLLGRFVSQLSQNQVQQLTLATKLAPFPWRFKHGYRKAFYSSKSRLQGHLDRVQLHWSTARYAPYQEGFLIDALAQLVYDKHVNSLGISNVGPKGLGKIYRRLAMKGVRLASVQVQFSLLTYNQALQREMILVSRALGIEVLAYSPLALGILSLSSPSQVTLPVGPRKLLYRHILPEIGGLLCTLNEIAKSRQVCTAQVALNWCRAHGAMPIPGLRNPEQAIIAAGALHWNLDSGELAELDRISQSLKVSIPENPFQSS